MASNYTFVRDARNAPNPSQLQASGWTPLIAYDDPYAAQYIKQLQDAGVHYGVWGDPTHMQNRDPAAFAYALSQYARNNGADTIVPDVEFIGKGYKGSAGWSYNQLLAQALQQYGNGLNIALTPMGNQHDFNYGAYKGIVNQWLPQSYGADPKTDVYNPQDMVNVLISEGVDPSLITPVLGVGNDIAGYNGQYSLYTADDFNNRLPTAYTGPRPASTGPQQGTTPGGAPSPTAPPAPSAPPVQRRSQSASMIQSHGLDWAGRTFASANQLRTYLASKGRSYNTWAQNHPTAASALAARLIQQGVGRAQ